MKNIFQTIILSIVILFSYTCSSQISKNSRSLIYSSNALKTTIKKDTLIKEQKWKYETENNIQLAVSFRNNPFKLDSNFYVLIVLDNVIVCEGKFSENSLIAMIPHRLLNRKLSPKLIICDNKTCFTFSNAQVLKTVTEKDNLLHLIFMPTNQEESIYFITTNYNLNEN